MGDERSRMFGWYRWAAIGAIVCSIAACVPQNAAWEPSDPVGVNDPPATEGISVADEGGVERRRSTGASYARPGKTCAAACRRFSRCKLLSVERCMKACADQGAEDTAESRRTNLVQARSSCRSLAAAMAPTKWLCIADGESVYGHNVGTSSSDVQGTRSVHLPAQGKTRAAAENKAIRDCNALMNFNLEVGRSMYRDSTGDAQETAVSSPCRVTQCFAPRRGRARRSRR